MKIKDVQKQGNTPKILVLGAKGMFGHIVYRYLKQKFPKTVWGTDRSDTNFLFFDGLDPETSYKNLARAIGKIDIVVNCIALLKPKTEQVLSSEIIADYRRVNTELPHILDRFSERDNFHLIHISTDAVFSPLSGEVYENSPVSPKGLYEKTKYAGETKSDHALTIRTSIIGLDPYHHKGILEWALSQKEGVIDGYTNQIWSGCTTLQLAELCFRLSNPKVFSQLRDKTSVIHFAPLGPITKYALIETILTVSKSKAHCTSTHGAEVSRILKSRYSDMEIFQKFSQSLESTVADLCRYENLVLK